MSDPAGTRREAPEEGVDPVGTRREPGSASDAAIIGTRREGAAGRYVRVNLPPELTELFDVVGEVASGGESDVL
ncbi:MAG: hypothetical protein ACRDZT_09365, partial [Acidimicrobiales bacterium]